MPHKPHLEQALDNILERGVIGPSVTPSIPYDEGRALEPDTIERPSPPPPVPADGTDAGG